MRSLNKHIWKHHCTMLQIRECDKTACCGRDVHPMWPGVVGDGPTFKLKVTILYTGVDARQRGNFVNVLTRAPRKLFVLRHMRHATPFFCTTSLVSIVRARDGLPLFCDMFLIDFFLLISNPMSASLKSLSIFVDSRSKVNLKVKYDFSRNEASRNSVIPHFHVILTGQSI